jgi:NADH-quinone oxidoreductase subunit N
MELWTTDFVHILPEVVLLTLACVVLLVDVYISDAYRLFTYQLTQLTLILTGAAVLLVAPDTAQTVLNGQYTTDGMATLLKLFILGTSLVVFVYAREYLQARNLLKGEFYVLGLFAVLGMMVLVSAGSLLTVYLGLELLSLSLYAMVALHRDSSDASEAAMKYFVLGALASGMLLYGMSMIYGATGTLVLGDIAAAAAATENDLVLSFGLVFLVVGIAFKLGAVPFHMWIPDVYEGAPTAVTVFLSTAPKLAAFAMLIRLLVDALPSLQADWHQMLVLLAVLSMAIGNVVAIAQSNLKRMFAYSTIAHVGFMLIGILAGSQEGYAAAMFYIIAYAIMGMGGFGMIILLGRAGFEADRLDDFKGLNERSPWFAAVMMVFLFSMAGVPPFLGFWAKWSVLREVIAADMLWVAVVAIILSVIGAYYYLRVVKLMYFDKAEDTAPLASARDLQITLSANGLLVLGLGLFPSALMAWCLQAIAL